MEKIKEYIENPKIQGVIAIAAAVVMYYTPDYIDVIIEGMLAALGISKLTISGKK